ncbi:hypothetical protein PROSTU_03666 [Providencia stuartii ATCC 25827]|uniref:Uncharacterized protein n=1 Tax=Providencia stuartii ATCC 25827 TaxID=471874 RepID=A0AA86Z1A9_PROST|nr:hypothetical protein PROSTU_03666 [Providencia stuartii ATCC 25827]
MSIGWFICASANILHFYCSITAEALSFCRKIPYYQTIRLNATLW